MAQLQGVLVFTLMPVAALIIGGFIGAFYPPNATVQSCVQHFAAGVVFAAAAGEILPELTHDKAPIPVIIGFAAGVGAMLLVRNITARFEQPEGQTNGELNTNNRSAAPAFLAQVPLALIAVVAVDLVIDGLLVGVGFAAGQENGILLSIALTLEILFLGLSTVAALTKNGANRRSVILITLALAMTVLVGILIGVTLLTGLAGFALDVVLAFGAAALLYLVTEELLVEAHEVPETALTTTMFFAGFLALFIIELIAQ